MALGNRDIRSAARLRARERVRTSPGPSFQTEAAYARPTWPSGPGDQQMMLHLDIGVDDLDAAGAHAVAAGAVLAAYQPQDRYESTLTLRGTHSACSRVTNFSPHSLGSSKV